ncbi:hypothetical protein AB1Y20_014215 [Prymnesium parvum]|uniref:COX assembly mitochondrial protein n=1 Tax=Prymnesium parvum TaxID=97485 RepID=A0AB34IFK7_PRYPA
MQAPTLHIDTLPVAATEYKYRGGCQQPTVCPVRMGSSTSRSEQTGTPNVQGFGVRMTPELLNSSGVNTSSKADAASYERDELARQAFQQGAEYAAQQLLQQQAELEAEAREQQLKAMQYMNDQQEELLRVRIEELHKREYRAPIQPMGCTDERKAALECLQSSRGAPPGQVVRACQQVARDLDKCAVLMREASLAKIANPA